MLPYQTTEVREAVAQVARLLYHSKRPLIHIGQGVRNASTEFERFISENGFPFVTARNANDMVASTTPLYMGRPGTFAQRGANFAVQLCDIYLAIGTRLSLPQTGYNSKDYARNARIIQVDIDQAELDKGTLRDPIKICADAKEFIQELSEALPCWGSPIDRSEWVKRCQTLRDKYPVCLPEYKDQKGGVNSYYFIDVLSDLLTPDDVIVLTLCTLEAQKRASLILNNGDDNFLHLRASF